ncbi:hypothetical protein [Streptomyces sp. NPDC058045]|uniref:hypothetical protein n=1 Tax=Streptomyces sp. NPDC058045 TaxID=3346311 RepID=UPI0036E8596D
MKLGRARDEAVGSGRRARARGVSHGAALVRVRVPDAQQGPVDWPLIERALDTPLPGDYVDLVHRYHGLVIDDWLGVRMPRPGSERYYVEGILSCLDALDRARRDGRAGGHIPYPGPGGLLPWGGSLDGATFYWRTSPAGPERWTVVVQAAGGEWDEVPRNLTGCLAGLVLGDIRPQGLPPYFPAPDPSVSVDPAWRP